MWLCVFFFSFPCFVCVFFLLPRFRVFFNSEGEEDKERTWCWLACRLFFSCSFFRLVCVFFLPPLLVFSISEGEEDYERRRCFLASLHHLFSFVFFFGGFSFVCVCVSVLPSPVKSFLHFWRRRRQGQDVVFRRHGGAFGGFLNCREWNLTLSSELYKVRTLHLSTRLKLFLAPPVGFLFGMLC